MTNDIKLTYDSEKNYYDINFNSNGDIEADTGLETAVLCSILGRQRADKSMVQNPIHREGHWTNELNSVEGFQTGSLMWVTEQSRLLDDIQSFLEDEIFSSLKWMLEDKIVNKIKISSEEGPSGYIFKIDIIKENNKFETYLYDAFKNTVEGI